MGVKQGHPKVWFGSDVRTVGFFTRFFDWPVRLGQMLSQDTKILCIHEEENAPADRLANVRRTLCRPVAMEWESAFWIHLLVQQGPSQEVSIDVEI